MDLLKEYFIQNFIIIFISLVILIHASYSLKKHPKISIYSIIIIILVLFLASSTTLENYGKSISDPILTLSFSIVGYTLRPTIIYLFILLTLDKKSSKLAYVAVIPLVINLIIYLLAFNDDIAPYIIRFVYNDDGTLSFQAGYLRYTSHVISAFYLLWFIYLSLSMLTFKRVTRGIVTLSCSLAVIGAVVIESFFNSKGTIYILNTVIAISDLVYYIYLINEKTELDPISGLYTKEKYYKDIEIRQEKIKGAALFIINIKNEESYKETIVASSNALIKSLKRSMIVYSFDRNEYFLLTRGSKEELKECINIFNQKMLALNITYQVGFAFKDNEHDPMYLLYKKAEKAIELKTSSAKYHNY